MPLRRALIRLTGITDGVAGTETAGQATSSLANVVANPMLERDFSDLPLRPDMLNGATTTTTTTANNNNKWYHKQ
jgi:hypothetical protein